MKSDHVYLYRIALQEETNRMSANALAIVFAPCILRCPDTIDPLQSVQDISKTTAYVQTFYSPLISTSSLVPVAHLRRIACFLNCPGLVLILQML